MPRSWCWSERWWVLAAPAGTNAAAARHNDEGLQAYHQQQWERAKQHFDAAIAASPEFAEAHYLRITYCGTVSFV